MSTEAAFQRKFPRRSYNRKVGLLRAGKYEVGQGLQIGEGGLQLLAHQSMEVGDLVVVTFMVPTGDMVSVQAEIRNAIPGDERGRRAYGLQFENLPFAKKRQIRFYVADTKA